MAGPNYTLVPNDDMDRPVDTAVFANPSTPLQTEKANTEKESKFRQFLAEYNLAIEEALRLKNEDEERRLTLALRKNFEELELRDEEARKLLGNLDKRNLSFGKTTFLPHEFKIYLLLLGLIPVVVLSVLAAGFSSILLTLVLPSTLVGVFGLMALNYIAFSRNWKVTAGRGVAVIISLATAVVGIFAASKFGLWVAIPLGLGVFIANIILYRVSLPVAIQGFFTLSRKFVDFFKGKIPFKDLSKMKITWRALTIPLALATGLVLTLSMYYSLLPATLAALALPGVVALGAPYILFPIIAIAFIANCIFVFRSLSLVYDFAAEIINIARYGIALDPDKAPKEVYKVLKKTDLEKSDSKLKPESFGFFKAAFVYYCDIKKADGRATMAFKFFFHVVLKLAVVALVVYFSQKALVDVNTAYMHEMLAFLGTGVLFTLKDVLNYISYSTRIAFVSYNFGKILSNQFNAFFDFILRAQSWRDLGTNSRSFFTKLLNPLSWWKSLKTFAIRHALKLRITVREQGLDVDLQYVYIAVYGSAWKTKWKIAYEAKWAEAWQNNRWDKLGYYIVKGLNIYIIRTFTRPAVMANSVSSGMVAYLRLGGMTSDSMEQFLREPPKPANAALYGVGSGVLTLTAEIDLKTKRKKLQKGVVSPQAPAPTLVPSGPPPVEPHQPAVAEDQSLLGDEGEMPTQVDDSFLPTPSDTVVLGDPPLSSHQPALPEVQPLLRTEVDATSSSRAPTPDAAIAAAFSAAPPPVVQDELAGQVPANEAPTTPPARSRDESMTLETEGLPPLALGSARTLLENSAARLISGSDSATAATSRFSVGLAAPGASSGTPSHEPAMALDFASPPGALRTSGRVGGLSDLGVLSELGGALDSRDGEATPTAPQGQRKTPVSDAGKATSDSIKFSPTGPTILKGSASGPYPGLSLFKPSTNTRGDAPDSDTLTVTPTPTATATLAHRFLGPGAAFATPAANAARGSVLAPVQPAQASVAVTPRL